MSNNLSQDTNKIEKIIADHNKAMREDMASEIVGGSRSKAITNIITVGAISQLISSEVEKARLGGRRDELIVLSRNFDRIDVYNYVNNRISQLSERKEV